MNRMAPAVAQYPLDQSTATLAIMGFAAEANLRDVAQALGSRDLSGLARVNERNAKQPRLRAEIEEQVVEAISQVSVSTRERRRLMMVSRVAQMFERMGARTVEISDLAGQIIRNPRPVRVKEIAKLIEHAVYITDHAATGLVKEDVSKARTAIEQKKAADELHCHTNRDLAALMSSGDEASIRADLLCRIACKAHGMIEEAGQLAQDVVAFLENSEI